mmetsp:Transcript_62365/g.115764  ORF Transcript_62365/g.115764 Transcript_62365/m.115764 type:complete len:109 (-) Transcript_62365:86-412(-)
MSRQHVLVVVAALTNVVEVCDASNATTSSTTTTDMPWGLPWWGWFLVCFFMSIFVVIPCLAMLVGLSGLFGEYESGQRKAKRVETVYQVVDEPNIQESDRLLTSRSDY